MLFKRLHAAQALAALQLAVCPLLAVSALVVPAIPAAHAQESVSVETFHEELAAYGRWVEHPRYGYVWHPADVDDDWRPYTRGHWVHTEEHGWLWSSDEPWGWATYHYGRWTLDEEEGWFWVPGSEWGPAWVDWRYGDGHIGWAPLGPEVHWRGDSFDYGSVDYSAPRYMPYWIFVRDEHFLSRGIYRHCAPPSRNVIIHRQTRSSTSYVRHNNFIVNRSLSLGYIREATRSPVQSVRVNLVGRPRDAGQRHRHGGGAQGGSGQGGDGHAGIAIFRPRVATIDPRTPPRQISAPPMQRDLRDRPRSGAGPGDGRGFGDQRPPNDTRGDQPRDQRGFGDQRGRPSGSIATQPAPMPAPGNERGNDRGGDKGRDRPAWIEPPRGQPGGPRDQPRSIEQPPRPSAPPPFVQAPSQPPPGGRPPVQYPGSGPERGGYVQDRPPSPPPGQPVQGRPLQGQVPQGQPPQGPPNRKPPPAESQPGTPGSSPGGGGGFQGR